MFSSDGAVLDTLVVQRVRASNNIMQQRKVFAHSCNHYTLLSQGSRAAIEAFCHTFEAKTNNDWEEVCSGVPFSRSCCLCRA
jgi:hypothetical protein